MIKVCIYISDVHSLVPSFRWGLVSVTFSLSKSSIRNCCFHRRHHLAIIYIYIMIHKVTHVLHIKIYALNYTYIHIIKEEVHNIYIINSYSFI